jgi:phosphatidate cytidylyltransferase
MLQRTLISLALLALAALLLVFRETLFPIFILLVGLCAQWEVYGAFRKGGYKPTIWTGMLFMACLYPVYTLWGLEGVLCIYLVLTTINLVWGVFMPQRQLKDTTASIFAMFYPGWCVLTMVMINAQPKQLADIGMTLLILIPCSNDIFAFLFGRFLGKTPLAPKISPKKTVEGALGGFGCGILVSLAAGVAFRSLLGYTVMPLMHYALVGALCGLFSQVGDLTASTLKRSMGIKDFSHVLGNHGGIMDRADSIMLGSVALFVFYSVFY